VKNEEEREREEREIIQLMERDSYRRVKGRLKQIRWCDRESTMEETEERK